MAKLETVLDLSLVVANHNKEIQEKYNALSVLNMIVDEMFFLMVVFETSAELEEAPKRFVLDLADVQLPDMVLIFREQVLVRFRQHSYLEIASD